MQQIATVSEPGLAPEGEATSRKFTYRPLRCVLVPWKKNDIGLPLERCNRRI